MNNFAYRVVEVGSADWTPISPTILCDYLSLRNFDTPSSWTFWNTGTTVALRTDVNDASTEIDLLPGLQEGITAPWNDPNRTNRFAPGVPVWYAKARTGTVDLVLVQIR